MNINQIYNEDCIQGMKKIPNEFIDLTITSPPYNLGVAYDEYNDNLSIEEYKKCVQAMCNELYRLTKLGGRVCINVPLITKDYGKGYRVSADQLYQNCLDEAGFIFREKIIWNKKGVCKRNSWGSYLLPSCPWMVYPTEVILVYYKEKAKIRIDRELVTITKEDFIESSYSIWWVEIKGVNKNEHPAVMPEEIPRRLVNFYSYKGDIVLDPFLGIGTTCIVAKNLNRRYLGFEMSSDYYNKALKQLCD